MKEYTAKDFKMLPKEIYDAAYLDGAVKVTHERYKGFFIIQYQEEIPDDKKVVIDGDVYAVVRMIKPPLKKSTSD